MDIRPLLLLRRRRPLLLRLLLRLLLLLLLLLLLVVVVARAHVHGAVDGTQRCRLPLLPRRPIGWRRRRRQRRQRWVPRHTISLA